MLGKRPPWMIKAVAASLVGLVTAGAHTVGTIWLYRRLEPLAPDWMIQSGGHGPSLLSMAALFGWIAGLFAIAILVSVVLVRVLRVPMEVIAPSVATPDYPEHRRPLSPEARARPGQEGFIDAVIKRPD